MGDKTSKDIIINAVRGGSHVALLHVSQERKSCCLNHVPIDVTTAATPPLSRVVHVRLRINGIIESEVTQNT